MNTKTMKVVSLTLTVVGIILTGAGTVVEKIALREITKAAAEKVVGK